MSAIIACALPVFVLAFAIVCLPIWGQATEDDANVLVSALGSNECDTRQRAISSCSRSEDNEKNNNAALRRLGAKTSAPITDQAVAVVALMEDSREGRAKILALTDQFREFEKLDKAARNRALEQMRQELLRMIVNPKERIGARLGAPWLLTRVIRESAADHPDWKTQWAQALETMLKSPDGSVRVIGAATATLHRFPEGSDPLELEVVTPLIQGLSHESVNVRATAYLGLRQLADSGVRGICFDPTQPPDLRPAAIRKWEEWLDANRGRLGQERIAQWLF